MLKALLFPIHFYKAKSNIQMILCKEGNIRTYVWLRQSLLTFTAQAFVK